MPCNLPVSIKWDSKENSCVSLGGGWLMISSWVNYDGKKHIGQPHHLQILTKVKGYCEKIQRNYRQPEGNHSWLKNYRCRGFHCQQRKSKYTMKLS